MSKKGPTGDFFFYSFLDFFFFQKWTIFSYPKKKMKKKIAAARLATFFCHFWIFFVFPIMDNIFLPQKEKWEKKKRKIAVARLDIITATRWTGNRFFVVDSLSPGHSVLQSP